MSHSHKGLPHGRLHAKSVPVTPLRQQCVILSDGRKAVVVDPGGDVPLLLAELDGLEVEAILLTHGHFDHVGGAADLRDRLTRRQGAAVPVLGPDRRDAFLLDQAAAQAASFGLGELKNVTPDRFLQDGETLRLLDHAIEVRLVPGHTPGHVVFLDSADRRAIVGDTLFRGTVGRTDFPYGDWAALIAGIHKVLLALPDETVVLCGHGLPTTIGEERRTNPFLVEGARL